MQVYVFGLGHIGLPIAVWISLNNYCVTGIDCNPSLIDSIINGAVQIEEYYEGLHISKVAQELVLQKRLQIGTKLEREGKDSAIFVVAVGIANLADGSLDLSPVQRVLDTLCPQLRDGDLVIFRTTLIPGTCEQVIVPQLCGTGKQIRFVYCPETFAETRAFEELENNPVILAGKDDESSLAGEKFFRSLSRAAVYRASNIRTAEMVKVVQNIIRDVNIALANELSEAALCLGIDMVELQTLVNTHPRVHLLRSGPGVGGYCLPNAYPYLHASIPDAESCPLSLISTARSVNLKRPERIVNLIEGALQDVQKELTGATIGLVGLAMKDYCADCRFSPALDIAELLRAKGAVVRGFDPLVPLTWDFQVSTLQECLVGADCLLLTARQLGVELSLDELRVWLKEPWIIVDTRHCLELPGVSIYRI